MSITHFLLNSKTVEYHELTSLLKFECTSLSIELFCMLYNQTSVAQTKINQHHTIIGSANCLTCSATIHCTS